MATRTTPARLQQQRQAANPKRSAAVTPQNAAPRPRQRATHAALAGISEKILLSKPHAAELLDISLRTLEYHLARGDIQGLRVGGRHMVPRAALDAWLTRQIFEQLGDALTTPSSD